MNHSKIKILSKWKRSIVYSNLFERKKIITDDYEKRLNNGFYCEKTDGRYAVRITS